MATEARIAADGVARRLAALEAGVAELRDVVNGMLGDLARLQQRSRLSRVDRRHLARLLPAIGGSYGSQLFLAAELFASASIRLVLNDLSVKQVGCLFRRAKGHQGCDGEFDAMV